MDTCEFEALLGRFSAAVEHDGGAALAALFCEDGIYHDVFYGPFKGRGEIARMLDELFLEHGERYRWQMREPVVTGATGYASWTFSFTSRLPEARGNRVVWEGMSRFRLRGGLIAHYGEMFDIAIALSQTNFEPGRIARIAERHVARLHDTYRGTPHLPGS